MLVVLLALGSPTHPVGESAWSAWTSSYRGAWGRFMGYEHLSFAPLFGHQYSHVWIDFRGIQDAYMRERGIDYFENTRRAVYAQRAYAIANPKGWYEYGAERLGLHRLRRPRQDVPAPTAAADARYFLDYSARGAGRWSTPSTTARSRRPRRISSLPFAPEIVIPAVEEMHARYGAVHLLEVRLPRLVQPQLHRHRRRAAPTAASTRRSAGSRTTTSASTRARSWR